MLEAALDRKTKDDLTPKQITLIFLTAVCGIVGWTAWTSTSPIPARADNQDRAGRFLKEQFPDKAVSPQKNPRADVAVVFHLIRHGEPRAAARAIAFAAEQDYVYATPYVIERLDSSDGELRDAARGFLRKAAGVDHGPDAGPWEAWWRDPPRELPGVGTVGQHSFHLVYVAVYQLAGVSLVLAGARWRRDLLWAPGAGLLVACYMIVFPLTIGWLAGSYAECAFGSTTIGYYTSKGTVIGLQDAKLGGDWLVLVLIAVFLVLFVLLTLAYAALVTRFGHCAPS